MPISTNEIRVGSIIVDTDYDYSLVTGIEDEETNPRARFVVISGPNVGHEDAEYFSELEESEYFVAIIHHAPMAAVLHYVNLMKICNHDKEVRRTHSE